MFDPNPSVTQEATRRAGSFEIRPIRKILLGAGAGIVMVVGSYWALQPRVSDGLLPAAAKLLPENTVAVIGLSIDSNLAQNLSKIGNPQSRQAIQQRITALQKEFLADYQLEKDIQPWLDREIYLAYLNVDRTEKLLLLPIRAGNTPAQVINQLKATSSFKEHQYQGITIWKSADKPAQAWAVMNGFVLLSEKTSAIEQAIQANKSNQNLALVADYRKARSAISMANPLVRGYLNLSLATADSKLTDRTEMRQGLAINGSIDGNHLTWRGVSWGKIREGAAFSSNVTLANRLPQRSLWALLGSDLRKFWQFYEPLATNNPLAPVPAETLVNSLKSSTGLDLSKDILSWSQGQFAIALVPKFQLDKPNKSPIGGGLLLLASSKDQRATDLTFASLDKTMTDRYRYEIKDNGGDTRWLTPVGGVQGSNGWLSNDLAFLSLGPIVMDQFGPSLSDRLEFRQVTDSAIPNPSGRFFMDLKAMQSTGNISLAGFPEETRDILSAVKEVGLTTASDATLDRFDLLLNLESVTDPAPSSSKVP
jgi:Protein of unknown function (DUF3352)